MITNFKDAVMPDGTTKYQMLAYIVAIRGTLDSRILHRLMDDAVDVFDLTQDADEFECWVVESVYDTYAGFCGACVSLLCRTRDFSDIVRCSLMFDGVYDGESSTMSRENSLSIYGVSTKSVGPVFCADMNILSSCQWRDIIAIGATR